MLNTTKSSTVTSNKTETTCDTSNLFEDQYLSAEVCEPKDKSCVAPKISEISTHVSKAESSILWAPVAISSTLDSINSPRLSITSGLDREITSVHSVTPAPIANNINQSIESNEPVNE